MSEPVKVPKGSKRCPNCQNLVKGPRTQVCPHDGCGHQFPKGSKAKVKPKASLKIKPTPVPKAQPDPWTEQIIATCDPVRKNLYAQWRAAGIVYRPIATENAMRKAATIAVPDSPVIESEVVLA